MAILCKEIIELEKQEVERQRHGIELIASENYPSTSVREIVGSMFIAKYAEGYPIDSDSKGQKGRYYGGCEIVDKLENLTRNKALEMFRVNKEEYHVNVQPHSGSQANEAALMSVLKNGDKILSLDLSHGGHLSHGMFLNSSGRNYEIAHYQVQEETGRIDYDLILEQAKEYKPKLIICGASAYSRKIDFEKFRKIADEVGAYLMADIAHIAGLIIAGLHNCPFKAGCDIITSTTHKTIRGNRGGIVFTKIKNKAGKNFAKIIDTRVFPGVQGGPLMNEIAGKLVAFNEACSDEFKEYQLNVKNNARALARHLKEGFANSKYLTEAKILSGGTDNHLILVDFINVEGLTGADAQTELGKYDITLNKNLIPGDKESPQITSGIRIGTPAITTRGADEAFIEALAGTIVRILDEYLLKKIGSAEGKMPSSDFHKDMSKLLAMLHDEGIDGKPLITSIY